MLDQISVIKPISWEYPVKKSRKEKKEINIVWCQQYHNFKRNSSPTFLRFDIILVSN